MTAVTNSTLAFYGRSQLFLGGLRADAETLQRQVSTGERIERSSDDPVAASRLRTLGRIETLGQIDAAKAQRVDEDLTLATDALSSVADDLIRVREASEEPGSLKATWPSVPIPSTCRSTPPASSIACS